MTRMITACFALAGVFAGGPALAHHPASVLGSVRITQPVRAEGTLVQPGTYEIRLTGEHLMPLPGQSEDAELRVEFLANGVVVARDVATVMTTAGVAVGTSGVTSGATSGGSTTRARVELLKGGEYLRVSMYRDGERYLIHLPVSP